MQTMKRIIVLSSFIFSFCFVLADSTSNKSHQIGINLGNQISYSVPYSFSVEPSSKVRIGRGLMYKYKLNNFRIRSTWDYYKDDFSINELEVSYTRSNVGSYNFSKIRLGIEYGLGNRFLQPYAGIDFLARIGRVSGEYNSSSSWGESKGNYIQKIRDYGIHGTLGLNLQLHKRFNFNIETSLLMHQFNRKQRNVIGYWEPYNLPRFIGISYLF